MNNVEMISTTTATEGYTPPQMTPKLGNTTYEVYIHFSQTSRETLTDKVMRLIRNDINALDMS
jgi:hypothetical protein